MILKGKQSFFGVPGVETVSGEPAPRRSEERSVITQAVVYITGVVRRAKGPVSLEIVERTVDEAAQGQAGAGKLPVLELRLYEEPEARTEETVFHLSYDAELRFLMAQGKISKNLVPSGFSSDRKTSESATEKSGQQETNECP